MTKYNYKDLEKRAWFRILKVLYIISYLPLLPLLFLSISDFGNVYDPITKSYVWNLENVFLVIIVLTPIYILIIEIIKKALLYIILGKQKKTE